MTRKFYHGRTETMRPCTVEAVKWCTAMTDPSCEVRFFKVEALLWMARGAGLDAWRFFVSGQLKEESHAAGL